MSDTWNFFVMALTTLLVIVEPLGALPAFSAMTASRPPDETRRIALRASLFGAALLVGFAFAGRAMLEVLGVRIDAFRMAGGLLLLLTALDMLRAKKSPCRCTPEEVEDGASKNDIAIVPLAIPLLSGPGAMAAAMLLSSRATSAGSMAAIVAAIGVTFGVTWVVLRSAPRLTSLLGPSAMAAMERVLGLVLAAMSLQFIVEGGGNLLRSTLA